VPAPDEAIGTYIERAYRSHRTAGTAPPARLDRLRDVVGRYRPRPALTPWRRLADASAVQHDGGGATAGSAVGGRPVGSLDYLGTARYQRFWSEQEIFALPTFSDTHLRVNVAGREGRGLVAAQAYGAVLDRWEGRLGALRDARTGRRVVAAIERTRQGDPFAAGPPADLVVRFAVATDLLEDRDLGRLGPLPFLRTGEHGPTGFVRVHDPRRAVRLDRQLEPRALGDLLRDLLVRG
jgi:hypothetical protein